MLNQRLRDDITGVMAAHRLMTLATVRRDGWPQATTVGYVNHGLTLFCFVSRLGQKFGNISEDPRVSVAIAGEFSDPSQIRGLSFGGRAHSVEDRNVFDRVWDLMRQRFPEYADWPKPTATLTVLLQIDPDVISLIDYSKGFGQSELVHVSEGQTSSGTTSGHDWIGA